MTMVKPMFTTPTFPERFNMAHYFLDARIEEGRGDHIAVIDDASRYSYRQVQAMANQVGNALSSMGVGVEDRIVDARDLAEELLVHRRFA